MKRTTIIASVILATSMLISIGHTDSPADGARATFTVHCCDVGAAALEGRPGIVSVKKGWQNSKEVNHVIYDPEKVSVQKIESWLKESGNYRGTVMEPVDKKP
jgi:hypothetical protein